MKYPEGFLVFYRNFFLSEFALCPKRPVLTSPIHQNIQAKARKEAAGEFGVDHGDGSVSV